ncbi:branched-chain amino acid ABC transporter permease [Microbacterium sp. zg.Y1090]|nr:MULTISPECIES: branched-chain amino acid ABC transporter permease [unclassified Microbacterium]MCR2817908.1 branched-chain amino acid ABC transporter permease [Microbacterium sp. zg.Y1090]MDL5487762.1 branched-chain amino acid ABC transporter permease [Microbacterium sp. zg-Y1211]WIM27925.1 branched-chain amino acid ABC transporter permease [Microbacterium sp. zg-Y1090]
MALLAAPTGAHAATTPPDTPGGDQEQTDYYFGGVITFDDEPVPDVTVGIEGGGFEAETVTGADGRWRLYVPEKDPYTLTVDESTLPDGVIVEGESASQEVEFGLTGSKIVNLFLGEGVRQTTSFIDQLVERIFNGLNFGLLLALAAIGVSLIFGTTGLTNFAHAEMVTFGAIIAIVMGTFWQVPMWITIPVVVIVGAAFGWTLDAGLWRPLRRRGIGLVPLMIVSIGLSLALRYLYQYFLTGSTYQLPGAGSTRIPLFGAVQLSPVSLMSMGISIIVIVAVALWLLRTRVGKATRAISDNPGLAAASGIDVDRVVRIVWMMAAALAALAGILWGYFRPGVRWDMGVHILLLIFAAVTLGGLGTAFGALVGAIIVGLLVEVSTLWLPSDLKYVGALVVLILILLVRPQGILGRKERLG